MATVGSLISGVLPPVGQPAVAWPRGRAVPAFSGFHSHWLSSGTAALALALIVARAQRLEVANPQVLIPAYGCPDLVAAAEYAGVSPVLVDICTDDPGYDLDDLDAKLNDEVIAIVAVNFLGLRERMQEVSLRAAGFGTFLIEDCAQWYPEQPETLDSDAIVLSFGRGKPVNLMGGGGLLLRDPLGLPGQVDVHLPHRERLPYPLQALAFNALIQRWPYGVLSRLPGTHLGDTRFKPLSGIHEMDRVRIGRLGASAEVWIGVSRWREEVLEGQLTNLPNIVPLPVRLKTRARRLLRYPVLLANRAQRDKALYSLNAVGLGASDLYKTPLPSIHDVPQHIRAQSSFTGAEAFAGRLLTLPLHQGVKEADLLRIGAVLAEVCEAGRPP